jgi:hypothetical protein
MHRSCGSREPVHSLQPPAQSAQTLSPAEAAALADAGLMPLTRYLDLAERNGWADGHAHSTQVTEHLNAATADAFAVLLAEPRQQTVTTKRSFFSAHLRWEKPMSRSARSSSIPLPNIGLVAAYAALAAAFLFILTVVAFAQTTLLNVS